ncbi:sulfatase [bacterium]|nr:sulfatase [candidate division CSSED10-310 bacterium]
MKPRSCHHFMMCLLPPLLLAGCAGFQERLDHAPASTPASVILLVLDTMRADHLSLYGHQPRTSPHLEALATESTLFTRAMSPSSWTLPGHASLFTGLYPFEHRAHTVATGPGITHPREDRITTNVRPLAENYLTLAEWLRGKGYDTAGVVANTVFMTPKYGLSQGFDHYDVGQDRVEGINARVLRWLDGHTATAPDTPFFLFVNYMDTHRPYNTKPVPGLFDHDVPRNSGRTLGQLYNAVMPQPEVMPDDLIELANEQYDTAAANLDAGLGVLFDALRQRAVFENVLLIVTADHGEYLGEHCLVEHSKDVYQEALWVPLIIKAPGQRRAMREDQLISLVHLPNIILSLTGNDETSPFPYHWPEQAIFAENHFARLKDLRAQWGNRFDRRRFVIFEDRWKFIHSTDERHELYDLCADPMDTVDLMAARPAIAGAMDANLRERIPVVVDDSDFKPHELSDEDISQMRSLGYL